MYLRRIGSFLKTLFTLVYVRKALVYCENRLHILLGKILFFLALWPVKIFLIDASMDDWTCCCFIEKKNQSSAAATSLDHRWAESFFFSILLSNCSPLRSELSITPLHITQLAACLVKTSGNLKKLRISVCSSLAKLARACLPQLALGGIFDSKNAEFVQDRNQIETW